MHNTLRERDLDLSKVKVKVTNNKLYQSGNIQIRDQKETARQVANILSQNHEIIRSSEIVKEVLNQYGFSIWEGFDFHSLTPQARKEFLLGLGQLLGDVTYTDEVLKAVVWDIQPRTNIGKQNATISEVAGEACLHTDTQYYPNPEKYFMLACDTPAFDGGESRLIDGAKLVADIQSTNILLYENLSSLNFPFAVPSSFTRSGNDNSIEIYLAPIIQSGREGPLLRFRDDTIERGAKLIPGLYSEQHQEVYRQLQSYLNQEHRVLKFDLKRNEIIIVNNHELLHGRGSFNDSNRLLYRIRMN